MKSWDVIIIGAGIIGLSLAISLRKQGLRVLIVERGEPGREASYAAAGMLAGSGSEIPPALKILAEESARLYPEFVHDLEDESGVKVDLRDPGTILISSDGTFPISAEPVPHNELQSLEPALAVPRPEQGGRVRVPLHNQQELSAAYLGECSVDPRSLVASAVKAAHRREVDISSGTEVKALSTSGDCVIGVETDRTSYSAGVVVNCAGAWAGCVGPMKFPVRPVKGQMLAMVGEPLLRHVVRSDKVYLVPRSDGRIIIGSTLEDAGFDKKTDAITLQHLFQAAVDLVPALAQLRRNEAWAGLRPGTPDDLPILGETSIRGYFVATGHYRDGILLAPVTAQVMTNLVLGNSSQYDLRSLALTRFQVA